MSSDDNLAAVVFGFGLGLYTFFRGFRIFRKYKVIADTPVAPIRSIAMGLVEVAGRAQGDEFVHSPATNTPCFFYKVDIERWQTDSKGRGRWAHYKTDADGVKFYLQDETGKVLVDLHGAELDVPRNARREAGGHVSKGLIWKFAGTTKTDPKGGLWPSESELLDYVARAGEPYADIERIRFSTASPLEVRRAKPRAAAGQAVNGLKQMFLGGIPFWGRRRYGGGRYRLTEYCVVEGQVYDATGTCTENPAPKDEDDRNMIVKGRNEPTFLISSKSEKELEGSLRRKALLYVFGGAAISLVCLAILLGEFGWL